MTNPPEPKARNMNRLKSILEKELQNTQKESELMKQDTDSISKYLSMQECRDTSTNHFFKLADLVKDLLKENAQQKR